MKRISQIVCCCAWLVAQSAFAQDSQVVALRAQLDRGDAVGVLDHVRRALGSDAASAGMCMIAAEAALALGQFPHARGMADLAVAKAPEDPATHTSVGHVLFALGEDSAARARGGGGLIRATFGDAAAAYKEARRLGGPVFDTASWEAEARHMAGEFDAALDAIDAAEGARANQLSVARLRATILRDAGRTAAAATALALAVAQHPADQALALLQLRVALAGRQREQVLEVFLASAQRFPESPELYTSFIGAYEAERPDAWLQRALAQAAEFISAEKGAVLLWYRGALDEAAGRYSAALICFEAYLQRRPGAAEGHFKLGTTLLGLNRLEDARAELLRAHAAGTLDPAAVAAALRGLVGALVAKQQFASSCGIQGIVAAMSQDALDELNLGVLLYQAGRRDEGLRVYRALAAREDVDPPTNAKAWNFLGLALAGTGDAAGAEAALKKSLSVHDGSVDARENLAMLLAVQGRRDESLGESGAALEREPGRPRALYARIRAAHPWVVGASN